LPDDIEPEETEVPIKGECGHLYRVPLARLRDGADFTCPFCGQPDRFDEAAVREAQEKFAKLGESEPRGGLARKISSFLSSSGTANKE
jgi:hypothetical protein